MCVCVCVYDKCKLYCIVFVQFVLRFQIELTETRKVQYVYVIHILEPNKVHSSLLNSGISSKYIIVFFLFFLRNIN